jgi:glycosyltransferase involved in cell wall biosynthesis
MHILVVPSWYPTGMNPLSGIFIKEQALAIKKSGHDVTVAFPELWSVKSFWRQPKDLGMSFQIEEGLNTYRYGMYNFFPGFPPLTAFLYYYMLKRLYKIILQEQGKPDVIHAHSCLWGGWAASKLAIEMKIPIVITEHSSKVGKKLIKKYEANMIKDAIKIANKIIVVGQGLKKTLSTYTDKNKIDVIPNIVNVDKFQPHSIKKSSFRFLSIAFLTYNKGMDSLISAFAKSFKGQNVELIIGGDGDQRLTLEKLAEKLGIQDQVVFLGNLSRDRVKEEMQKCDVFVLASRFETFGVVYIEALACGKPIIATACGGPEDIVNKNNGVIVSIDDIKALGTAMQKMKNNYLKFDSKIIRDDCIKRFSEFTVVQQINKVYEEIV